MQKINKDTMEQQYASQLKTFCAKNSDYGNSFEESLEEHGLIAGLVRIEDKINRIKSLMKKGSFRVDESLADTLTDLSNYSAMLAVWIKADDELEESFDGYVPFEEDEWKITAKAMAELVTGHSPLERSIKDFHRDFETERIKNPRGITLTVSHGYAHLNGIKYKLTSGIPIERVNSAPYPIYVIDTGYGKYLFRSKNGNEYSVLVNCYEYE